MSEEQERKKEILRACSCERDCLTATSFISLQCNREEMPGKCFNLPILIQNAKVVNQVAQSKYPCHFLPGSVHSTLTVSPPLKQFGGDPTQQQIYSSVPLGRGSVCLWNIYDTLQWGAFSCLYVEVLWSKGINLPVAVKLLMGANSRRLFGLGSISAELKQLYCKWAHVLRTSLPG